MLLVAQKLLGVLTLENDVCKPNAKIDDIYSL